MDYRITGRRDIAFGDAGVMQTLDAMAELIHAGTSSPLVIQVARQIVSGSRGPASQANAIRAWLAAVWHFVDDPINHEVLMDAPTMLAALRATGTISGDCDETAILGATLAAAVGLEPVLTVLGFTDESGVDRLSHVYAEVLTADGARVNFDVTRPTGRTPSASRSVTVSVF